MGAPVLRYKNAEVPRQQGEVVRLRVIQGPDQGITYIIRNSSVILGRGEESGVMITDLKASRSHASLEYTQEGWVVNDLGSANGILFQGEYVRKFPVNSGEHFTIGETIFEFLSNSESTRVLTTAPRPAQEMIQQDQAIAAQRLKVKNLSQSAQVAQQPGVPKKKTNPLLIVAALGAGVYLYWDQIVPPKPTVQTVKKEKKEDEDKTLSSYLPNGVTKEVEKTAEQYYRQGFREYREQNYLRAKAQFELALQVNPSHAQARHYLASAEHEIETSIKEMIGAAQKAKVAGRLREAKGYYETAMRLMYYDRSNPDFVECEEGLKKIKEELAPGL